MSCFILSESNDIPIDFWNYINLPDKPDTLEYLSLDDAIITKIVKGEGNGFFVEINNNVFVITCFHIIKNNNVKNTIYYYDDDNILHEQNAKMKIGLENLDIAVLEIKEPEKIPKSLIHNKNNLNLNCNLSTISNMDTNLEAILHENGEYNKKKIYVEMLNMNDEQIISSILPNHEVPCYNIKIIRKESFSENNGLSGSPVFSDEKIIGMIIMNKDDNNDIIIVLPIQIIFSIASSFLIKKRDLSGVIFSSSECEIELDKSVKYESKKLKNMFCEKTYYGHIITDNLDISYVIPKIIYKKFKFMQDDIILKINDDYISENGKIFSNILNTYFKINTYLMIHSYLYDSFEIVYLRDETIYNCVIKPNILNDMIPYNITKNPHFIYYEGLIFMELSDKLMEYFKKKRITLYGEINPVKCDKVQKYVALVYTNYNYFKREYKRGYEELLRNNFPHTNNKIFILNKIGNEIVSNLYSLRTILIKKRHDKQTTYNYNIMNTDDKIDNFPSNIKNITLESKKTTYYLKFAC
jgi:hypothetical protein